MDAQKRPLVSIGIPTYNRPEGLKKTLDCITKQTYTNLEIIVSNNNPMSDESDKVVDELIKIDSRIKYHKQKENIGAANNFKFVLSKATGEFFMWAADDDYRTIDCIEYYMSNIGSANAFFSSYAVVNVNEPSKILMGNDLTKLSGRNNDDDLRKFVMCLCPSMFYGMFNRASILSIFNIGDGFDWADCFLLIKFISKYGFKTLPDGVPRYFAGIEGPDYEAKPTNGKRLNPTLFFLKSIPYVTPLGFTYLLRHTKMCINAWRNRKNLMRLV